MQQNSRLRTSLRRAEATRLLDSRAGENVVSVIRSLFLHSEDRLGLDPIERKEQLAYAQLLIDHLRGLRIDMDTIKSQVRSAPDVETYGAIVARHVYDAACSAIAQFTLILTGGRETFSYTTRDRMPSPSGTGYVVDLVPDDPTDLVWRGKLVISWLMQEHTARVAWRRAKGVESAGETSTTFQLVHDRLNEKISERVLRNFDDVDINGSGGGMRLTMIADGASACGWCDKIAHNAASYSATRIRTKNPEMTLETTSTGESFVGFVTWSIDELTCADPADEVAAMETARSVDEAEAMARASIAASDATAPSIGVEIAELLSVYRLPLPIRPEPEDAVRALAVIDEEPEYAWAGANEHLRLVSGRGRGYRGAIDPTLVLLWRDFDAAQIQTLIELDRDHPGLITIATRDALTPPPMPPARVAQSVVGKLRALHDDPVWARAIVSAYLHRHFAGGSPTIAAKWPALVAETIALPSRPFGKSAIDPAIIAARIGRLIDLAAPLQ